MLKSVSRKIHTNIKEFLLAQNGVNKKMACKNCGSNKAIVKKKKIRIGKFINKIIAFYCLVCGNLVYGKVQVTGKAQVLK